MKTIAISLLMALAGCIAAPDEGFMPPRPPRPIYYRPPYHPPQRPQPWRQPRHHDEDR